ncbi:MAG: hypothetical protein HY011_36030 [Acidobacteria bacterium]|nr:hypothetical protein [Acidobacteriota bacterium]
MARAVEDYIARPRTSGAPSPPQTATPPQTQAQPLAPPPPIEMGKGKTKNVRKINPDVVKVAEEGVKKAREEVDRLKKVPNKTPADTEAVKKAKRELNRQLDRLKKSEEDTRTGKGH